MKLLRLYCIIIVLFVILPVCKAQTITFKDLIGIPFLSDKDTLTRLQATTQIKNDIFEYLKGLQNWPERWDTLKGQKAITIRYGSLNANAFVPYLYRHRYVSYYVNGWGGAWDYKSLDSAKQSSLKECMAVPYPDNYKYLNFLVNDNVNIPDSMVTEFLKFRKNFIFEQQNKLGKSTKGIILDSAIYFAKRKNANSLPDSNIRLTYPDKIKIGYPDNQQDYASACQDRVFYGLLPVPNEKKEEVLGKLSKIINTGTYNLYYRSYNTIMDYKDSIPNRHPERYMEKICNFSNHIVYKSDPRKDSLLTLPMNLEEAFKGHIIKEVWVEGACRYTEKGIPLEVSEYAKPLAILSDKGLFIGVQFKMPDDGDRCYVSAPFKNKIISMTLCLNNMECAKEVINALSTAIENTLSKAPFSGIKLQPTTLLEGELDMGRLYQPSLIFGSPYFEYSTYSFKTSVAYTDNPFYSLYNRQIYRGVNKDNVSPNSEKELYAFLEFNYTLKRAVHKNGKYLDPDDEEKVKFEIALRKTLKDALLKTCEQLKGKMQGSICEILKY